MHASPWSPRPSRAAADPGAFSTLARLRTPSACALRAARWQPWSPRTTRAAGAPRVPRPRSEGLAGGLPGCSVGGAAVGTQALGYRVQVTKGRGLLEAVQAPLPGTKWGPVLGSPSGGPRAWRLPECPTGWRALSALGHQGCTHRPGGAAWGGPARSCGVKYLVGSHRAYPDLVPLEVTTI